METLNINGLPTAIVYIYSVLGQMHQISPKISKEGNSPVNALNREISGLRMI